MNSLTPSTTSPWPVAPLINSWHTKQFLSCSHGLQFFLSKGAGASDYGSGMTQRLPLSYWLPKKSHTTSSRTATSIYITAQFRVNILSLLLLFTSTCAADTGPMCGPFWSHAHNLLISLGQFPPARHLQRPSLLLPLVNFLSHNFLGHTWFLGVAVKLHTAHTYRNTIKLNIPHNIIGETTGLNMTCCIMAS